MVSRAAVVAEARTWMGTRWQHQARVKGLAVDCIGLIGGVAVNLNLPGAGAWADDRNLHNYGRTPSVSVLLSGCERFMDRIPTPDAREGDVLVMAFNKDPQHFGIISRMDPTYIIHAYASVRRVVENGIAMSKVKVLRAYHLRGVE
jgi:cell wall-associated NlpC family hydrolase